MDITPDSTICRRAEVTGQGLALVMRNSATDEFYGLESIALRIWQLFEQPRTVAAICVELRTSTTWTPQPVSAMCWISWRNCGAKVSLRPAG